MGVPALTVRLTRASNTHHRLEVVRADGSFEASDLETRSCLFHDLVHLALESEAGLRDAFFGRLAQGDSYATLSDVAIDDGSETELAAAERVVGPLQGWLRRDGRASAGELVATLEAYASSTGGRVPEWFDADLVEAVAERVRRLEGEWKATPFGKTMELEFRIDPGAHTPRS